MDENSTYLFAVSEVKQSINTIQELLHLAKVYQESDSMRGEIQERASNFTLSDRIFGYSRNIAYYYDTMGWLCYRIAVSTRPVQNTKTLLIMLDAAEKYIEASLQYDQSSSIVYYHMTRIILTRLERTWQTTITVSNSSIGTQTMDENVISSVDNYLIAALYYWSHASQKDQNNRLGSRLPWLRKRIEDYRFQWDTDQLKNFRIKKSE